MLIEFLWWTIRLPHPFWWEEFVLRAAFLNPAQGDPQSIRTLFAQSIRRQLRRLLRLRNENPPGPRP